MGRFIKEQQSRQKAQRTGRVLQQTLGNALNPDGGRIPDARTSCSELCKLVRFIWGSRCACIIYKMLCFHKTPARTSSAVDSTRGVVYVSIVCADRFAYSGGMRKTSRTVYEKKHSKVALKKRWLFLRQKQCHVWIVWFLFNNK